MSRRKEQHGWSRCLWLSRGHCRTASGEGLQPASGRTRQNALILPAKNPDADAGRLGDAQAGEGSSACSTERFKVGVGAEDGYRQDRTQIPWILRRDG